MACLHTARIISHLLLPGDLVAQRRIHDYCTTQALSQFWVVGWGVRVCVCICLRPVVITRSVAILAQGYSGDCARQPPLLMERGPGGLSAQQLAAFRRFGRRMLGRTYAIHDLAYELYARQRERELLANIEWVRECAEEEARAGREMFTAE